MNGSGQLRRAVGGPSVQPWAEIPRELADEVKLGALAEEITEEIHRRVPEYARRWDEAFAGTIRAAVDRVLEEIEGRIGSESPEIAGEPVSEFFQGTGRSVAKSGRSLDTLQTAVRIAGLVVWRRISEEAERLRLSPQMLCTLGEIVLLFQDEVAAAAAEGYAEAQAAVASELERRRQQLLNVLLRRRPAPAEDIAELARVARWPVPRTVAAVALHESRADVTRPSVPPDILIDLGRSKPCLIVPDPDGPGRSRILDQGLSSDWVAAVGPTVPIGEVARSMNWAYRALDLQRRGVISDPGIIRCVDHMSTLIVFQDEELLMSLATMRLAPLAHLRSSQQDRLAETLLAWLQSGRNANEVAVRLHVHPQTVRYRLRQLEEFFGDQLQDRDLRFELEIVLRARALGGGPSGIEGSSPDALWA
jgi:PucR C-terminal helix-turn-helix domain